MLQFRPLRIILLAFCVARLRCQSLVLPWPAYTWHGFSHMARSIETEETAPGPIMPKITLHNVLSCSKSSTCDYISTRKVTAKHSDARRYAHMHVSEKHNQLQGKVSYSILVHWTVTPNPSGIFIATQAPCSVNRLSLVSTCLVHPTKTLYASPYADATFCRPS